MFELVAKCFVTTILLVLLYNLFLIIKYYRIVRFSWKENGRWIPLLPFLGNAYVAIFTGVKINMLSTLLWAEKYCGMPVNFWFAHKYHYMCNNAEEARIILNHPKCLNKAQLYDDVHHLFNNSILLVPAEQWKRRRRCLRNAFKTNLLTSFIPNIYQQSNFLIDEIKLINTMEDIYKFFNKYSFRNFYLASNGWREESISYEVEKFGEVIDRLQDEFVKLLVNPIMPASLWMKIPSGKKYQKLYNELQEILKKSIANHKEQRNGIPDYNFDPTEVPIIDLLLGDLYEKNRESDVFDEYILLAGAATDTTGHTLAFCFTLLGMFPEIQQQLYEEVLSVIGEDVIDHISIKQLVYTEAVISETLRILPTVPLYGRYCTEDIDIGAKVVPKGANVFISAFHIHRNPEYWKDPLKFDPTRFLPENLSNVIPGSFLAFSAGPRNCIGQSLAMILLKVTVANVVRHFRITSNHKTIEEFILTSCISMKTLDNLDCNFLPRNCNV